MDNNKHIVAMIYDFDGTLAPGNMQEYDFLKEIGVTDKAEFWRENNALGKAQNATEVLSYMKLMIDKSNNPNHPRPITRQTFKQYGASIPLFKGVKEWFALTRKLGEEMGLQIEHYINSSGLQEMVEGSSIAMSSSIFMPAISCTMRTDEPCGRLLRLISQPKCRYST